MSTDTDLITRMQRMSRTRREIRRDDRFVDMAREEFVVTANAFFAPMVGAVHVLGSLLDRDERDRDAA